MEINAREYLEKMRWRLARHHFVNWTTSVHTRVDLDMTLPRQFLSESGLAEGDKPVTLEHLWLCAAARVLRARPVFNVAYDGLREITPRDEIHFRVSFNLGGKLAWGIIENADKLDPQQMAEAYLKATENVQGPEHVQKSPIMRKGRLGRLLDDVLATAVDLAPQVEKRLGLGPGDDGGTFSVLNAGAFGAEDFHAVLLRPAAAMLVVLKPKFVVQPGENGPGLVERVPMSVPFNHNLMDTDAAGYFLFHMQQMLDDPEHFLMGSGEEKTS